MNGYLWFVVAFLVIGLATQPGGVLRAPEDKRVLAARTAVVSIVLYLAAIACVFLGAE